MWAAWTHRLLATAGAFAVLWAYGWLSDREPEPALLAFAVVALAGVVWLARDTLDPSLGVQWQISPRFAPSRRGFDARFSRLAQDLSESNDREAVAFEVHSVLARVAEDLLRSKYNVDPTTDPQHAREILGEPLADYLANRPQYPRRGYDRQIGRLLERLESL